MRRKGVGLLFREDVQVITILRGNLWEQKGVWRGNGGGRKERGRERGSSENGRRRGGEGRGGEGGGWWRCDAGRRTKGRGKGKETTRPVNAGVVPGQPRKAEHHLEVTQPGHLKGKVLYMSAMNPDPGRDLVSDGYSRGGTTVYEL